MYHGVSSLVDTMLHLKNEYKIVLKGLMSQFVLKISQKGVMFQNSVEITLKGLMSWESASLGRQTRQINCKVRSLEEMCVQNRSLSSQVVVNTCWTKENTKVVPYFLVNMFPNMVISSRKYFKSAQVPWTYFFSKLADLLPNGK